MTESKFITGFFGGNIAPSFALVDNMVVYTKNISGPKFCSWSHINNAEPNLYYGPRNIIGFNFQNDHLYCQHFGFMTNETQLF